MYKLFLILCLSPGCFVPRQQHAETLRELELTKGRLSDSQKELKQLTSNAENKQATLTQEKNSAEQRANDAEARAAKAEETLLTGLTALGAALEYEQSQTSFLHSLLVGNPAASSIDTTAISPTATLFAAKDSTQKPSWTKAATGWVLGTETKSLLSSLDERLSTSNGRVFVIGHADGTTDNLKTSLEYASMVGSAMPKTYNAQRIMLAGVGDLHRLCDDPPRAPCLTCKPERESACVEKNNRIVVVFIPAGF